MKDYSAPSPVHSAQRLQLAAFVRFWNYAIDFQRRSVSVIGQHAKQIGADSRHIAGDNQVPFRCFQRKERGFESRKRPAVRSGIRDNGKPEGPIKLDASHQANGLRYLPDLRCNVLCQRLVPLPQQSLIAAHSAALAAHQNEAGKAQTPKHLEMITLQYVTGRLFLALLACFSASLLVQAEPVPTRTTVIVRADAHTGRLVRSVVVAPRIVSAVETATPAVDASVLQPAAAGSLTEMIDAIAERNQVEAPLVHSVIKAESNYNPAALSPKGAQGLMQLIPSTARRFGVTNSFNVQENVEGGVKYLKFLMELYHNDYVKVIAAYNAGEGAVAKYGGIPPYSETINYVYRVGRNLKTARQFAELKAAEHKVVAPPIQTASVNSADQHHPIQAVTGDDGKVYYRTQ